MICAKRAKWLIECSAVNPPCASSWPSYGVNEIEHHFASHMLTSYGVAHAEVEIKHHFILGKKHGLLKGVVVTR